MKKILFSLLFAAAGLTAWADEYYLVGGCTDSGWNAGEYNRSAVRAYTADGTNWAWVGYISAASNEDAGRFKIPNSANGWDGFWAPAQNTVITSEGVDLSTNGSGDNKFRLAETGYYLITFNTSDKKIYAQKLTEPSKDGDYFLISSVNDYYYFAAYIATDETKNAKARLTADLSFEGKTFTPMASDKHKFKGEFNGSGHTIDYAVAECTYNNVGLFTYVADGANIHDLVIGENSSFKGNAKVGGFAGFARDGGSVTLTNVINRANVTSTGSSDANAAGFIGCATDGTKIIATNCANTGTIKGQNGECAAFAGWTQSGTYFTNCWNSGTIVSDLDGTAQLYRNSGSVTAINCFDLTNKGDQGTKVDASKLSTGEFCYIINGDQSSINWYQNLTGTVDAIPVPFSTHSRVYANGELKCDGTSAGGDLTYSNSSESFIPPHTNVNGWCTVCGTLDSDYLTADGDGFYSIGNANDLHWFAEIVSQVNQSAKAKLTADIDYSAYPQGFIGTSTGLPFRGVFDGQEHTLTINIVNNGTNRTGLFAYINAATIENLVVEGSATSADNNCVGGLGGRSDGNGTLIKNVIVKTAVSYTGSNSDATCGGFFANMEGQVSLKNCAFLGSINSGTAEGNGGLVGWAGGGGNNKYINCLVAPTEYTQNGNSADFARNNPNTTNCYKVASADARLASGELCYMLNDGGDNWFQNLGTDANPVPFSSHSHVYANGSFYCDGTPKGTVEYGNTNDEHHDPHVPDAYGFCTNCPAMISYEAGYMTPAADGYYEISDNKQMRWFAAMIKDYRNAQNITENDNANAPVNARLMNDIDFADVKDYAPIGGLWGAGNTRYNGTFDGQGYQITNLNIDLNQDNVGVFGVIAEGAVIKNFTLASSCSIKGNGHVGIVGEAWRSHDGNVYLECLGNEANITGIGTNVGGILGVNMINGSYAKLYMTNCYSTGKIKSTSGGQSGQLTGWTGDNAVVKNCYAIGEMENCDGFARLGGGSTVSNSYCDKDGTSATKVTSEQITSGEVCAKLGYAFRQNIGSGHPCFDQDQGFVTEIKEAGWSTQYIKASDVEIPTSIDAFAGTINGDYLTLAAISEKIKAGEPVVLQGEAGLYNFMPTTGASAAASNELKGSDGDVTGGADIYALAKKSGSVGFYPVGSEVTIPAGKAYLKCTAPSPVKGFTFVFDDATGINTVANGQLTVDNEIYNLSGQRINKMQKGINIVNGKKILF